MHVSIYVVTYINRKINLMLILLQELKKFFKDNMHPLSCGVAFELYNKWYIYMLFTNLLILSAIIMKIISEYKVS